MNSEGLAYTIPEWCAMKRITRGMFYILDRKGDAPETIWIGRLRRITAAADRRWEERQRAPIPSINEIKSAKPKRGRKALPAASHTGTRKPPGKGGGARRPK